MSGNGGRTRRELLADAAKGAAAASLAGLAGCFPSVGGRWLECKASSDAGSSSAVTPAVVEVLRQESVAVTGGKFVSQPDVVASMLDAGLAALARQAMMFNSGVSAPDGDAGAYDSGEFDGGIDNPWAVLLPKYQSGQRIGLKVNCLGGNTATSPALVRAIIASLRDKLGVNPAKEIIVWDRGLDELHAKCANYSSDDLAGATLLGTKVVSLTPQNTPGEPDYGAPVCEAPTGTSGDLPRLSRILTDMTDLTINCPILKTHSKSGFTAALKNIYGIIDIPGQFHDKLVTDLPKLFALPAIRSSISLTIVDALIAVINHDTMDPADATPRRILLGLDPVALDSYALTLLNQLRAAMIGRDNPIKPAGLTDWIANAAALNLGSTNYSLIQV
jgi:uncharacterized protein (DUF362 family)